MNIIAIDFIFNIPELYFVLLLDIPFNATTCSKDAFMRGSGQKVVGFSFYGDINTPKNKKKGIYFVF